MLENGSRKRKLNESGDHQDKRAKAMATPGAPDGQEDIRITVGLLLRSDVVGKLIGKGGKTINGIREESQSQVNIHKQVPDSPERTAEVAGESTSVAKALELIATKISEPEDDTPPDPMISLTMLIESLNIGCVIGKKGAKISKIRQDSQARVQIGSQCLGESTQKTVEVSGNAESVSKAIRYLVKYLEDAHQPVRIPYEPANHHPYDFPGPHHGQPPPPYQGGPRQPPPDRQGNSFLPGQPHNPSAASPRAGNSMRSGPGFPPAQFFAPPQGFHTSMMGQNLSGYPMGAGMTGASPSPGHPGAVSTGGITERIMNVPDSSMGRIIGKGGTRIQDIRIRSGAKIHISAAATGSTERVIKITGQASCVEVAQSMLQMLLDMRHQSAYGGGGGGGGGQPNFI